MKDDVVGIDLGTTYSLAARMVEGKPQIIIGPEGRVCFPSVIHFAKNGSVEIGENACRLAHQFPEQTLHSVKRLMGRSLSELANESSTLPYSLVEKPGSDGRQHLVVQVGTSWFTPEELSARILSEIRRRAGFPNRAVITVPAYFDDTQRQATRDAARIAGFDVLRIVSEPTAAALAYGLDRRRQGIVAVYDFGGGTFDCSILSISDGVFKVLSTRGNTQLGGDDIDRILMKSLFLDIESTKIIPGMLSAARDAAEKCKIALTFNDEYLLELNFPGAGYPVVQKWSRSRFEKSILQLVRKTLDCCRSALRDAKVEVGAVDEIILVGGSTRIPLVRLEVEKFFGKAPHTELNPDEVVALGAAVQADLLTGGKRKMLLLDVVPLSMGIETLGGAVSKIIHRNTVLPSRVTERFTTGVDNQTAVHFTICQGERELLRDCRILGKFKLSNIPPMPAQMAQVDVTFLVDANGILTVSAKEMRSGTKAEITIIPEHGLTREEVDQLVLESVDYAREDFSARKLIELCQKASGMMSHTRRVLETSSIKIRDDEKKAINIALDRVENAQKYDNALAIELALSELNEATQELAGRLMDAAAEEILRDRRMSDISTIELI